MNVLILNGAPANGRGAWTRKIKEAVEIEGRSRGLSVTAFDLAAMNIQPCRGCFACWLKHPGTCAIRDDQEAILRSMAAADLAVWITPITFGGYSPALKRALDRSIPNILPFFIRHHGEIHHPQRYERRRRLVALGTLPAPDAEAEGIFHNLAKRNSLNLGAVMTESCVFYEGTEEDAHAARMSKFFQSAEEAR